ncbi:hypothetical protein HRbin24_02044 [bacterium HR24]|nr:hypothetical protein HRbin24_02044 [bacterium HR24]
MLAIVGDDSGIETRREHDVPAHHVGADTHEGHRDPLTAAGALAVEEGGGDGAGGTLPRHVVAHAAPLLRGRIVADGEHGRHAAAGPESAHVIGRAVALLVVDPVAADVAIDQARVEDGELFVGEAEVLQGTGAQVGDEHVGTLDELPGDLPAFFRLQVQGHAALAPVVLLEGRVEGGRHAQGAGEEATERVAVGWLQLDDVGAPVGQDGGAGRPRHPERQLDHLDAFQRTGHGSPSLT